ncbi:MAG: hypothetical protein DRQ48_01865 [Gammaproteobacteria bacterium]|nr:MAG: hypothetical protein DRQ48_01865 [Gammaproteobacteria bacterium]
MSILAKAAEFVGGGLFKEIKEGIMSYFPPDVSPVQKAEFELKMQELLAKKEADANQVLNEASAQLDTRIKEQEGTASDLKTIPVIGHLIIFLRGVQRPLWGYATLYMDWMWFSGGFKVLTEQQQTALIVINMLVLGFLFGERTMKNLEPLLIKLFAK